jgi:hypothetical protein
MSIEAEEDEYGSIEVEEDKYGGIEVEEETQTIVCGRTMYFVKLSKDGKTAFDKYDPELQFSWTAHWGWRSNWRFNR